MQLSFHDIKHVVDPYIDDLPSHSRNTIPYFQLPLYTNTLFDVNICTIKNQTTIDLGGYWWPPTYSSWTPTIVSFSFPVSLIVAEFTIFGSFRVLNFQSRFEALNNVLLASNGQENMSLFRT